MQHCLKWILVLMVTSTVHAELRLPNILGDNMVLQSGQDAVLWGWGKPGAAVRVRGSWGAQAEGKSGEDGRWRIALPTPKPGGPYEITIADDASKITLTSVMVGEVWVCSGQSNMEWSVAISGDAEREIAGANHPQIRLFHLPRTVAGVPQDDCVGAWQVCRPGTVKAFSAVAYSYARKLQKELGVPVGVIQSAWGGTRAEAWTRRTALEALGRYEADLAFTPQSVPRMHAGEEVDGKQANPYLASVLYNGMIAPLTPLRIRGVIWYQGESNHQVGKAYETLFPAMIADWRKAWGQGEFPFYFVQIAPYNYQNGGSPELREAQRLTLAASPNTGMVVTTDIATLDDIHPPNKQDVGKRLARWALRFTYGKQGVVPSGPLYREMQVDDGRIRLSFAYADGLVARDGPLREFQIAGADRVFRDADAKIDGDTIVVSHAEVPAPVAVRFGWSDTPQPNLFNGEGLPASPFRTDRWDEVGSTD